MKLMVNTPKAMQSTVQPALVWGGAQTAHLARRPHPVRTLTFQEHVDEESSKTRPQLRPVRLPRLQVSDSKLTVIAGAIIGGCLTLGLWAVSFEEIDAQPPLPVAPINVAAVAAG
ncbi:hypothetical protein ACFPVT_06655 [Corynebacterium choanae]|uniref:Uncharacterized protein n=1 Tax=Corynebacterium choanae TaxID=1862358 RepID=A0A3G6J6N4_9CORY|nr:hypothetical protein [Corynebacterium choanae]AZA13761.1 hypothetical protein CCHOA_06845 [Corynebacterium choanae]